MGGGVWEGWAGSGKGINWYKAEILLVRAKRLSCWAEANARNIEALVRRIMGCPKYLNDICRVE